MDIAKKSGGKVTLIQIIKILIKKRVFDGFIDSRSLDFRIYIFDVFINVFFVL